MTYKVEFTISPRRGAITKAVYCPKNCPAFAREYYYNTRFNEWVNEDFTAWRPGVESLPADLADFRTKLVNISNNGIVKASGYTPLATTLGVKRHTLVSWLERMEYAATIETKFFKDPYNKGVYIKI